MTQAELKMLLNYDPETGVFTWLVKPSQATKQGSVAGHNENTGYNRITIKGKRYLAHLLAWLYVTGSWPEHEIDHKDGNGFNNRYENLRSATHGQNEMNKDGWAPSGYKGVSWDKSNKKWQVRLQANKRMRYLGRYSCPIEAAKVYDAAAREHHGEFAKTNFDN